MQQDNFDTDILSYADEFSRAKKLGLASVVLFIKKKGSTRSIQEVFVLTEFGKTLATLNNTTWDKQALDNNHDVDYEKERSEGRFVEPVLDCFVDAYIKVGQTQKEQYYVDCKGLNMLLGFYDQVKDEYTKLNEKRKIVLDKSGLLGLLRKEIIKEILGDFVKIPFSQKRYEEALESLNNRKQVEIQNQKQNDIEKNNQPSVQILKPKDIKQEQEQENQKTFAQNLQKDFGDSNNSFGGRK